MLVYYCFREIKRLAQTVNQKLIKYKNREFRWEKLELCFIL